MDLLAVTHFLNGFLMIGIPILLGIYLTSRFRLGWKYWLIGGVVFIISQVFHIPFNLLVLNPVLLQIQQVMPEVLGLLVVSVLLGLSAGIFESSARYFMYRWWIKDARTWRVGVLSGAGHGGIESILLGVLVLLTYFNMVAYRNIDLGSLNLIPERLSLVSQQLDQYWNLPWYDSLFGALERMFTIPFHIAASVLVLQVFTHSPGKQQFRWLVYAILLHTLMDASAVFISNQWGIYLAELFLGLMAIFDIFIIFALRQPEPITAPNEVPYVPTLPPAFTPGPVQETSENLENTRYQ